MSALHSAETELVQIVSQGLYREPKSAVGIDFASNDYLGYSRHPQIHARLLDYLKSHLTMGSTGSRLISGDSDEVRALEIFLGKVFGSESSLVFGSGYLANMGVCTALGGEHTEFFSDQFNHASVIDGIRLARSGFQVFKHNDLNHLGILLKISRARRKVIVTESVFSMEGDLAPLREMIALSKEHNAYLVVDEAHATGVMGENFLGELADLPFDPSLTIAVHTCGKALGAYGAFVCSSSAVRSLLLNKARTQIFSTALSPVAATHIRLAVEQLLRAPEPSRQLRANIQHCAEIFQAKGLSHSKTHIVPMLFPTNRRVMAAAARLRQEGYFSKAVRSPTVPVGQERVRITLKAFDNPADYERIAEIVTELR
jgi:8-amino-7-oxononanoate synthase